jgi:hypothetical protein
MTPPCYFIKTKSGKIPVEVSARLHAKSLPTVALSTSGIRVEVTSLPLSLHHKLPQKNIHQQKQEPPHPDASCKKSK